MQTDHTHAVQVHLSTAGLDRATRLAQQQGVSVIGLLDQTLEEVLAMKELLLSRNKLSDDETREFLRLLDKAEGDPIPGDELPPGYERVKY